MTPSMTTYCDVLTPGLHQLVGVAASQRGSLVKNAQIRANFVEDHIELAVVHTLFSRDELDDESFKNKFKARVGAALGIKDPEPAKTLRVERRQLRWRGEQAARRAPRPIAKRIAVHRS